LAAAGCLTFIVPFLLKNILVSTLDRLYFLKE